MATDSSLVRVAVTGAVSVGATSATAPTGTSGTLTGFNDLGLVGEDGVTESRGRSTNSIKAWQNGATVRTVVTDGELTYHFVLLETKKETVELYYGATVTAAAADGSFVIVPTSTGGRKSFVIDVIDGAELERVYIPQGEVTEVGDKVYANGEPIGYECTVTAYADATIGGSAKVWATALKTVV
jgi:hypothetical protein